MGAFTYPINCVVCFSLSAAAARLRTNPCARIGQMRKFVAGSMMSQGNRQTLLAVDEESSTLREIEAIASRWFRVVTTRMPGRALGMVKTDSSITVVLVDQNLTTASGL